MNLGEAKQIVEYYLDLHESLQPEEILYIPVDWLKYSVSNIYEAMLTLARTFSNFDAMLPWAQNLIRISSNLEIFHACCVVAELSKIDDHLKEMTLDIRPEQREIYADLVKSQKLLLASITEHWAAVESGNCTVPSPVFALRNFNCDEYEMSLVKANINKLGECFEECGDDFPVSRLPAPREELLFCLAMEYVVASKRTRDDYQLYKNGASLLSRVVFDDEAMIGDRLREERKSGGQKWEEMFRIAGQTNSRKLYALLFYYRGFEHHCGRIAYEFDIGLPEYSSDDD